MKKIEIIKRYANRKFYSVSKSDYVTLAEILEISKNADVLIVDNKTKTDITKLVLASAEVAVLRNGPFVSPAEPVPLITADVFAECIEAIVSNAARDRRQSGRG